MTGHLCENNDLWKFLNSEVSKCDAFAPLFFSRDVQQCSANSIFLFRYSETMWPNFDEFGSATPEIGDYENIRRDVGKIWKGHWLSTLESTGALNDQRKMRRKWVCKINMSLWRTVECVWCHSLPTADVHVDMTICLLRAKHNKQRRKLVQLNQWRKQFDW